MGIADFFNSFHFHADLVAFGMIKNVRSLLSDRIFRWTKNGLALLFVFLPLCSVQSQIVINEFMPSNASAIVDPDFGESADWIELYNSTNTDIDISGYYLSDNINDSTRWAIPAGTIIQAYSFLLVWADGKNSGLHTSFKLSAVGEEIGLYTADLDLIDSFSYTVLSTDISRGRETDGSLEWRWFSEATPGSTNNTSVAYDGEVFYEPAFSVKGGLYGEQQIIALSSLAGEVRFTTDGTIPTLNSEVYNLPIVIGESTFLRARVFIDGYIPGPVVTHSYFLDESLPERGLPVISIVSDPAYFWDPEIGIYVQDFKPDWEHPINIEYFENDGSKRAAFNERVGVKINGLWSWQLPQKMLGIYFRDEYGNEALNYPLFHDRSQQHFEEFALRASGSDWSFTLFRDGLCQSLTQENGPVDYQGFRPGILFINGEYMGIHNVRSRVDGESLEEKYGLPGDGYDLIENDGEIVDGSDEQYIYMDSLFSTDLSVQANFDSLAAVVDIQNFTDYWITEIWASNSSWGHNVKLWKPKVGGKWQFLFADLDRGFTGSTNDPIDGFTIPQGNNYDYARTWLRNIFSNSGYADYFVQRFADHLHTTYHPTRVHEFIDRFSGRIRDEIPYHVARWTGTTSPYGDGIATVDFWENQVLALRQFAEERQDFMLSDLQAEFGLQQIVTLSSMSIPAEGGSIVLNEFGIPGKLWSGSYFQDLPFTFSAKAAPGYTFQGWSALTFTEIFGTGESWNYLDTGEQPLPDWHQLNYDDSNWLNGNAELGYGDGDEATTVSYGPDPSNKHITTYFRKVFTFSGDDSFPANCRLSLRRDDGAVVYLNGEEIVRSNMPGGQITSSTTAISAVGGEAETALNSYNLQLPLLNGENVLAVEIHQSGGSSSDISFDAAMEIALPAAEVISSDSVLYLAIGGSAGFVARFLPTGECILPDSIITDTTFTIDCSPYLAQGDIHIAQGAAVTIDPGVEFRFPEGACLRVEGELQVNGTESQPVLFRENSILGATSWGNLSFHNSDGSNALHYLEIRNATRGQHPIHDNAAISAWYSTVFMDYVTIMETYGNPVFSEYSDITLTNSRLHSSVTGDLINIKYGNGYISDCYFAGNFMEDTDAIDYDEVIDGTIRNSRIEGFYGPNSDGIDVGEETRNLLIENCFINECTDKAVSIGQSSNVILRNSTIVNCNLGMGIKDLGAAEVNHVTFYSNVTPIACYEKNPGMGGGTISVGNSIFSNSVLNNLSADEASEAEAFFCLYDGHGMEGPFNFYGNPEFVNPGFYDFQLAQTSPAIASGLDAQNIGSLFHVFSSLPEVFISQISYLDPEQPEKEYLRILNPSEYTIDISGYSLAEAVSFTFPEGTALNPGESILLAKDLSFFSDEPGQAFAWIDGKLDNEGELILLKDSHGIVLDHVHYLSDDTWPVIGTTGQYIEVADPSLDNHFSSSWILQQEAVGVEEVSVDLTRVYPNPAAEAVYVVSPELIRSLELFDLSGRRVLREEVNASLALISLEGLMPGCYLVRVNGRDATKLMIRN